MDFKAVDLAQSLIRFPSVTPDEAGSLGFIENFLKKLKFIVQRLPFGQVDNLFAKLGEGKPQVCFVGHVDVVPAGDLKGWSVDPFSGIIQEGALWGRGAADMKGAIACFLSAVAEMLKANPSFQGCISILLTSDEEGPAVDGIQRLLPWLRDRGKVPDFFLIGEPTGLGAVGREIKIGRRGSLTGHLVCKGTQGHIAYPALSDNPIPRLVSCAQALLDLSLDEGDAFFEPSRLEITSLDVGNSVTNLVPSKASLRFGLRFNTQHQFKSLSQKIKSIAKAYAGEHMLELTHHGNPFLTQETKPIEIVCDAVSNVLGKRPLLSTSGGTSDGRFLTELAPVIECGLPEDTIHQVNENVKLEDISCLHQIYLEILNHF